MAPAPATIGNVAGASDTAPTLALALVYNAWEVWIGNDVEVSQLTADDPSRYPGMLVALRGAVDRVDFGSLGPVGSRGMVITYSDQATVRVPSMPLGDLRGRRLETQQDYFGTVGLDLVAGVKLALAEVKRAPVGRRAIIILGDGNDSNNDTATAELAALRQRAAADGIEVYAIIYKSALSAPENVVSVLVPDAVTVDEARAVGPALEAIATKLRAITPGAGAAHSR